MRVEGEIVNPVVPCPMCSEEGFASTPMVWVTAHAACCEACGHAEYL